MASKSKFSENILSIRLSPNSISYWLSDSAKPEEWGSNDMKVLSPSSGVENEFQFDETQSLYENVQQITSHIMSEIEELPTRKIVYIDTHKNILVPEELYIEGSANDYVAFHNIEANESEQVDVSLPIDGTISIMVSAKEGLQALGELLGEFAVASLLQYNLMRMPSGVEELSRSKGELKVYLSPSRVYLALFDVESEEVTTRLLLADSYPVKTIADVVFYLSLVNEQFDVRRSAIYIKGRSHDSVIEQLSKFYNTIQCG